MSAGNHVALVTPDQSREAVQGRLEKVLGREIFACPLEAVRRHIGPDTPGCLLLAATAPDDAEAIRQLIQEVRLQRWPLNLFLLETEEAAGGALADLGPYLDGRLVWPAEASRLTRKIADCGLPLTASGPSALRRGFAPTPPPLCEMIGRQLGYQTPSLLPLVKYLTLAAMHDITVLLTGETGTGKTYLARLMHDSSPRRHRPFVSVPCGALSPDLVESAFFGHVKGAFTGADRDRQGKFAAAAEGTILLDEIDTLGLTQQASLLRVIETGEYEAVGSNRTVKSTARIIAASNWDLEEAVSAGRFRQDLYYRLNIMSFHLPPLRERVRDIPPLARALAARFNAKFRKDLFDLSPATLAVLESFAWPGNIRELENVIQQAVLCSTGPVLRPEHLPAALRESQSAVSEAALTATCEDVERGMIQRALLNCGDNRVRAARALGISRVTLYKKMRKYGLIS